jgi:hypothetical protein
VADDLVGACEALLQQEEVNYVLLDAARDPLVRAFILEHAPDAESLYAGIDEGLVDVAPYLLPLAGRLESLMPLAWGNSWGVFLRSEATLAELRKHFRRFLMVQLEDGEEVYFRFYDPRVLRVFLPTCTAPEREGFLGPVQTFVIEGEHFGEMVRFRAGEPPGAFATLKATSAP